MTEEDLNTGQGVGDVTMEGNNFSLFIYNMTEITILKKQSRTKGNADCTILKTTQQYYRTSSVGQTHGYGFSGC